MNQLTVGQLRNLIANLSDDMVVIVDGFDYAEAYVDGSGGPDNLVLSIDAVEND